MVDPYFYHNIIARAHKEDTMKSLYLCYVICEWPRLLMPVKPQLQIPKKKKFTIIFWRVMAGT
jgi:hypothetical protein